MKVEFTIHSPMAFVFVAELRNDTEAATLAGVLAEGQNYPVSYRRMPYQPEPEAPWPVGPLLEDM